MAGKPPSPVTRWVLEEARSIVPQWFAALFLGASQTVPIRFSAGSHEIVERRGGFLAPLQFLSEEKTHPSPVRALRSAVIAELPAAVCLARRIEAPARSSGQLASIAALDLVRRTPFHPGDIHTALSVPRQEGSRLVATQWVIRRKDVDRLDRNLSAHGFALRGVQIEGETTTPSLIADFSHRGRAKAGLWKTINGVALAAIVCAVFAVWFFTTWQHSRLLPSLRDRLQSTQTAAVALRTEIESLRSLADEQTAFLSAMVGRPHLSQNLRELTIAIPDETWLSELSYSQASLVLSGETSGSAAELVLSLAEVRSFGNPRLSGPVSRSAEGGERFEVVIDHRRAE